MKTRTIRPLEHLDAELAAPPSKSVTNRALIVAALAEGRSTLLDPLRAEDTDLMAGTLRSLGIGVREAAGTIVVEGCGGGIPADRASLNAGNAGTTMRFLTALAAAGRGDFLIDGSARMRERPIGPLGDALVQLGAEVEYPGSAGYPPVRVRARGLRGGAIRLEGEVSSQFLSAVLMVGPCCKEGLEVEVAGRLASAPYVDLTVEVMGEFGVPVERPVPGRFRVSPGRYSGREYRIEGDYTAASYFLAAAAVTGGRVRVRNLRAGSRQGDRGFLEILERMGCGVEREGDAVVLTGGPLRSLSVDLRDSPDLAQTLAVVALFAQGATVLSGLENLRFKETDRLAGLASELGKLGALVRVGRDHLEIEPRALQGAEIETYGDHRMAMAFAVAGLRVPRVAVRDPDCVAKSYPRFWNDFDRLYP